MSSHRYGARVEWQRDDAAFTDNRYSRQHRWRFDGGIDVVASASPQIVPLPLSTAEAVDPEEAFVAALSSCHMLWFLSIAAARGYIVERYEDDAEGVLEPNAEGRLAMTRVTLRPQVAFEQRARPSSIEHDNLHHEAHRQCFLATSVTSVVTCHATDVTDT